ncbi:hypothetical protein HPB51_020052 [Rhipicephalus microplus]|uniref:CCHC-type domain-containing protein n=1 Tax=Rhipicephalus microplus TaxID=6941 RepID=A0A9J6DWS1_RHIMP|nr:hypothetical protein HPB51_020052 [Rhipicephalus microplus]
MSKPVPNFLTVAGHRIMLEYRGLRRVCARCSEVGHMASACSTPYCMWRGSFGHDTEGCEAECRRGPLTGTIAHAARSCQTGGTQPHSSRDTWVVDTSASEEKSSSEREAKSDEVGQAALSTKDHDFPPLQRGTSCEAIFDDNPIQSRGHYVLPSEISSTAPGPSLHAAADAGSREGTSPEIIYGPGLKKRHQCRSRRRPMDGTKPENTGRAESAKRAGCHSRPLEGSSDSDAASRKKPKKSRKGSVGDGLPTLQATKQRDHDRRRLAFLLSPLSSVCFARYGP